MENVLYDVSNQFGRRLLVYKNRVELYSTWNKHMKTHEKPYVLHYRDLLGTHFEGCGLRNGYLEFLYPGSMNQQKALAGIYTTNTKNCFAFGALRLGKARELSAYMEQVNAYINERISAYAQLKNQPSEIEEVERERLSQVVEQLLQLKMLLSTGDITQEEYDKERSKLL